MGIIYYMMAFGVIAFIVCVYAGVGVYKASHSY